VTGLFITVEGTEGVGKSTNIEFVESLLRQNGVDVLVTREPGGTTLGEELRSLLLEVREQSVSDVTELLLIFAARAQHIHEVIRPALAQGRWVLCDRFTDATYAYQGGGRGLATESIATLESLVQGSLRPDHTILLDVDVETGLTRARGRGALDRIEQENMAFFEAVRSSYLALATAEPERFHVIDAARSLEQVQRDLSEVCAGLLDRPPEA
jgi:dTMP kinase